jgi:hypothetical protein
VPTHRVTIGFVRSRCLTARTFAVGGLAAALVLSVAAGAASSARAPTYVERTTIMDAFNKPGRSFAAKCVRIVVSTVDPRYAKLVSPVRPVPTCVQAGEVGDGYVLFRRATRRSLHWRDVVEASDVPPCRERPQPVLRDLFQTTHC